MTRVRELTAVTALVAACVVAAPVRAQDAASLRARHAALAPQLAASPFGRPVWLSSDAEPSRPHGEVHAIVGHPFARLQSTLQDPEHWCEILILPFNVKRCAATEAGAQRGLHIAVARRADQPPEQANPLELNFDVPARRDDYLLVQMDAERGPFGTHDYRLVVEAMPLDAQRSLLHLSYAYGTSFAARIATETYLATTGRDKVGFSIAGRDAEGRPVHVAGWRGIAERNTMRYFLAVEAFLDTAALPPGERTDARLRAWFAAVERYPRQLHEMPLEDYLAMKHRDLRAHRAAASPAG